MWNRPTVRKSSYSAGSGQSLRHMDILGTSNLSYRSSDNETPLSPLRPTVVRARPGTGRLPPPRVVRDGPRGETRDSVCSGR